MFHVQNKVARHQESMATKQISPHRINEDAHRKKRYRPLAVTMSLMLFLFTGSGCNQKNDALEIGVLQWTEMIHAYNQTCKGVLDGLSDKGYKNGINLKVYYRNAEQDQDLAREIAREFVKKRVALIVALGTGSSLAALEATRDRQIPIVYSIVGAPKATGIIREYDHSGFNITGVSMKVEAREQLQLAREILPLARRLGILYCISTPQASVTGKEAAAVARELELTPLSCTLLKEELPQLGKKVESLVKEVDAIYIPTDPIMGSPENLETIIRISDAHKIPVIVVTRKFVEAGALMAVHCDFYEIGRQAANAVSEVLAGVKVEEIPSQRPVIKRLSLNLKKAQALNIKVSRNVILRADYIID